MLNEPKTALKIGLAIFVGCQIAAKLYQRSKKLSIYSKLQNQAIKNISQIDLDQDQTNLLIKVLPHRMASLKVQIPVYSNQVQFVQPSQRPIINSVKTLIKSRQKYRPLLWICCDQGQEYRINGFGEILDNIFSLQHKFVRQQLGFFKSLWKGISWLLQSLFEFVFPLPKRHLVSNSHRRPILLGPYVGYLDYKISLLDNTFLVLKCRIEDHKIMSEVTSLSKSSILKALKQSIFNINAKLVIMVGLQVILIGFLMKDLRQYLKMVQQKLDLTKKKMFNPKEYDEAVKCIICYNACRNMIFFDCQHMVLCWDCSYNYKEEVCPICKKHIKQIKQLYNDVS